MLERDHTNLLAIIDAAKKVINYTKGVIDADEFFKDQRTFDATLMNFVIIGETVAKLSDEIKDSNKHIPWSKIKGFRNIVAHNYFGVDAEEVWQIIHNNIPTLIEDINKITRKINSNLICPEK